LLLKDGAFFDANPPTEFSAKMAKETSAIQRGTGEKVGTINMGIWSFVLSFIFAFYWGWFFTLLLLVSFPFIILIGMFMGMAM